MKDEVKADRDILHIFANKVGIQILVFHLRILSTQSYRGGGGRGSNPGLSRRSLMSYGRKLL
jgi:hypothetical protein